MTADHDTRPLPLTRTYCMRKAAWCLRTARTWDSAAEPASAELWRATAATWRAAGKRIPRRLWMVCARARRRYRKRCEARRMARTPEQVTP